MTPRWLKSGVTTTKVFKAANHSCYFCYCRVAGMSKILGGRGTIQVYIYIYIAGMIFPSPWNRVNIYKGISLEEMLLCKSELLAKSCESLNFLRQVYQKQLECHLMLICIDRTALACYDYIQIFCFL